MRRGLLVLLLAGVTAAAWTAVGSQAGTKHTSSGSSVTIANVAGMSWTCGFNPFNSTVQFLSFGPIYEELVFVNELKSGTSTPWLASKFKWSNHAKTLTFTIRKGVKWSDGKPLTSGDVLFTFQLLKKHRALDLQAVWSVLKSVSRKGSNVVFKFKSSAAPYFYYVAGQTPIVPKHIWAGIKDPVKYTDKTPVGSGPYTTSPSTCNAQRIIYKKNTHYWQKGKPKIDQVVYPAYTDNSPANLALATGQDQWGGQFIPNIKSYYRRGARTTTTGSRRLRTCRSSSTSRTRSSRTSPFAVRWRTRSTGRSLPRSASTATSLLGTRPGSSRPPSSPG